MIIRNAFSVPPSFLGALVESLKDETIVYDVRNEDGLSTFECKFHEFISLVADNSDHDDYVYFMNEDVLNSGACADLVEPVFRLPAALATEDYFQYFPPTIRPKMALVIGGAGARSFLHVDPFEWTGWNHLLEGRKLWTFLPPLAPRLPLRAAPKIPDSWGPYNLTCGWVSDLDLYLERGDPRRPSLLSWLWRNHSDLANDIPEFSSGCEDIDEGRDSALRESMETGAVRLVQEEGDLVLIPPGWWHQVYHLQPSIAVASQFCGEDIKQRVFDHILEWSGEGAGLTGGGLSPREQVQSVLRAALLRRHGPGPGERLFRQLYNQST